jgi:putative oxidoreductase
MTTITHHSSAPHTSAPRALLPFLAPLEQALSPFAEPLLRMTTGLLLVPHGAQKLFGWFGGYGPDATGQFFATKLGLPASLAVIAGVIEFFGGIALALGLLTRPIAALVAGMMAVAVISVHLGLGFFWTDGGFEYPLFWGVAALYFVLRGGGHYSLDRAIGYEF